MKASKLLLDVVPALAPPLVRALFSHTSMRYLNPHILEDWVYPGKPYIGVVWHQDFLLALNFFRGRKIAVMVSRSKDGEIVSRVLRRIGFPVIRGSSSSGGREALLEFERTLKGGTPACVIADGPRGPARKAKIGCVAAARETGAPILTLGVSITPCLRARNWDRTVIPHPFASIVLAFGEPIWVPKDASREDCERIREKVDERMAELEATCRRASGAPDTTPGR